MARTIESESSIPMVHQVARMIRRQVARGELEVGNYLPSVRELGRELDINFNTVAKAYRILEREGLVEIRHGLGARIRDARIQEDGENSHSRHLSELEELICRLTLSGSDREDVIDLFAEAIGEHYGTD